MMQNSRLAFALCSLPFVACTQSTGSVGEEDCTEDSCFGASSPDVDLEGMTFNPTSITSTRDLPTLKASWVRPLDMSPHTTGIPLQSPALLSSNSNDRLWVSRPSENGRQLEVYRLGMEGEIETTRVITPTPPEEEPGMFTPPSEEQRISTVRSFESVAGPLLSAIWQLPCDGKPASSRCSFTHLLGFDASNPEPVFDRVDWSYGLPELTRTMDGDVWEWGRTDGSPLRRSTETGSVLAAQKQELGDFVTTSSSFSYVPDASHILTAFSTGGVALAGLDMRNRGEIRRFDREGTLARRTRLGQFSIDDIALIIDSRDQLTLVYESSGELWLAAMNEEGTFDSLHYVKREHFKDLAPLAITRDAADNVYVLTSTGGRDDWDPTVCRLTPHGKVSCMLIPECTSLNIVGGPANVLYTLGSEADALVRLRRSGDPSPIPNLELKLLRFDFPD